MEYPPKRRIKEILQFRKRDGRYHVYNIGSVYVDNEGRQSGVIDLNRAEETPKGDKRYLHSNQIRKA